MEYSALSIFHDITNAEVDAMIQCFRMRRGEFAPGQTICVYGESGGEVGVLLRGEAELVRFDYAGTRTILERLETGGVFGEALAFTPTLGDCVEVVSDRNSEVLFMEYEHIMKRCERACTHHSKLVRNMFRLVAEHMFVGCDVGKHFVVGLGQMLALIGASHLQWGAVLNMLHKVPHGQHHQLETRCPNT